MDRDDFINYYEMLGAVPGASAKDIARRFHRLAKRYHPDNPLSGNRDLFDRLVEAHGVLRDEAKRAAYDRLHEQIVGPHPRPPEEPGYIKVVEHDVHVQENLLLMLYTRRRRNIRDPGVPDFEIERLTGCAPEELEFHFWYLKAKRWIERLDSGMVAITVEGIDHINAEHQRRATTKLLTDASTLDDELD
jgi:curved DNA-binding protein CbpA